MDWSKPPRVVAHRGASAEAPENTMAAFERALASTPAIELDVHLTKDGVPVVLHDADLARTTNGRGRVGDRTAAEVTRLRAGAGRPGFEEERVPTLADVFARFGKRALFDVELKSLDGPYPALPKEVGRLVVEHGLQRRVMVTSFDPDAVQECKVRHPEIRGGVLSAVPLDRGEVDVFAAYADALALRHDAVTPEALDAAARHGLTVLAWTVNDRVEAQRLWGLGVDAVVTDTPALLA